MVSRKYFFTEGKPDPMRHEVNVRSILMSVPLLLLVKGPLEMYAVARISLHNSIKLCANMALVTHSATSVINLGQKG